MDCWQALDQAVGQGCRHEAALDRTFLGAEGVIGENHLHHSSDANEHHKVGFRDGAVEGAELLSGRKLFPGEAEPERLHVCLSCPAHDATVAGRRGRFHC
jgi:hypothetical protein